MTEADVTLATLGSWSWALDTGGAIIVDDEATLVRAMGSLAAEMNRPAPDGVLVPDVGALSPPDSKLAVEAGELWREAAPIWLRGHGYRTWFFARGLAAVDGLAPDLELLFVAFVSALSIMSGLSWLSVMAWRSKRSIACSTTHGSLAPAGATSEPPRAFR